MIRIGKSEQGSPVRGELVEPQQREPQLWLKLPDSFLSYRASRCLRTHRLFKTVIPRAGGVSRLLVIGCRLALTSTRQTIKQERLVSKTAHT
jgi:hypothetical protein